MSRVFSRFLSVRHILCILFVCFSVLSGCKDNAKSKVGESEDVLSFQAKKQLHDKKYQAAIDPLVHLSNNYQVSADAQTYKLELMHAQFKARDFLDAIETADQYILLYPFEPNVDYAMYMKVIASLREFQSRHWMPRPVRERYGYTDTEILDSAMVSANMLVSKFPKSVYVPRVIQVKSQITEILLRKNYSIAYEYRLSHAYAASQKRLTDVIMHTESKKLLHKSLRMMRDNYISMQQPDQADHIDKLIKANWR